MLRSLFNVIPVVSVATCQSASEFVNSSDLKNTSFDVERILINKEYKDNNKEGGVNSRISLKKRSTSIGRLAYNTATASNPSIVTFVMTLSEINTRHGYPNIYDNNKPLDSHSFAKLFDDRVLTDKRFDRFASNLNTNATHFTTQTDFSSKNNIAASFHPTCKDETKSILANMMMRPFPDSSPLWSSTVSTGPLSTSGTLPPSTCRSLRGGGAVPASDETVVFFRASHALGDGVSMGAVLARLSDEGEELEEKVREELDRRRRKRKKRTLASAVTGGLGFLYRLFFGLVRLIRHQLSLSLLPFPRSPLLLLPPGGPARPRTVAWTDVMSVEDATTLTRAMGCTINDLFVAAVARAVSRLEAGSSSAGAAVGGGPTRSRPEPRPVRVVMPVHLYGGYLLPGQSLGNRIGGVCVSVSTSGTAKDALRSAKDALGVAKETPAPAASYCVAKVVSSPFVPKAVAAALLSLGTKGATVAVSNVRGPSFHLHVAGRRVESVRGFVPPPPGVPVGVVVGSYAGRLGLTVNADGRVVEDGERFLGWVVEEVRALQQEYNAGRPGSED
mmetsp:Transcript_18626/g.37336  ORF Transcript_18626/g.37336 Transcript_18626/m.37336 type:complete len:559 (+) Transcript_18626:231-1907(+)